jgi:cell division protein FtsQ
MALYLKFMKELDSGGQGYSKTVSEADVTDPDDLKALISSGGHEVLVHFGDEKFLARYNSFEKLLPTWLQQYPKLASADMRYQGQIVLEMQKGSEAVSPLGPAAVKAAAALVDPKPFLAGPKPVVAKPVALKAPAKVKAKPVAKKAAVKKKPAKVVAKKVAAKPGKAKVKAAVAKRK